MDGVSWSATRAQESFSRSRTATDTLSRLATFIARADPKAHTPTKRQQPEHAHTYVCPECAQDFLYAPDLLHHQEVKHSLPKPHRCPSCGREFSLRSSLQLHKCDQDSSMCDRCHGDSQPASPCPACGTRPSDAGRLQDASAHLVDSSPYACAPCGRSFSQKQALLQHQQAGCGEPPPPSDIVTSPPVSEADSTRSDSSDAPGPSSRVVRVCLQRHKLTGHSEQQLTAAQGPNAKGSGSEGGGAAPNRALVKMPRSKKKLLTCRSCDMVFGSTSLLYVHRKDKHSRERELVVEPRPVVRRRRRAGSYPCPVCGKVLVHHLSLRAHLKQHTDPGPAATGEGRPLGASTKDSEASEDAANQVRTSEAENRSVKPGRGRPRKVPRLENRVTDAGRCREVPEEEVKEEEEEEEALEKEFPCPSCAEVFPLQSQLREHVELHQSSVKRRQCSVCTDEMDTCKWPGSKRQRLYHCVPCQQGFSALDSFLEHCQEHLRVRVEEDSKA